MQIKEMAVLIFLSINTYSDIKTRRIMIRSAAIFGAGGILLQVLIKEASVIGILCSLIPGILLLGISKVTKEALGYGDGIVILILGMYLGLQRLTGILLTGMLLAAVWAGVLLIIKRGNGKREFPFLPFLMLGYLGGLWV